MKNNETFRWLRLRWRGLFQRREHEGALDREMQFHLDMLIAENVAAGMAPEEARFAAMREFGGTAQYREECRDSWRSAAITGLLGDFTFALRSLRRSPGFTFIAAFTLALGIGVNSIVFSFVRDAVLKPHARDERLNLIAVYNARDGADRQFRRFSYPEFRALQASTELFADVVATSMQVVAIGPERNLQRRFVAFASENYFSLLAVRPAQGRFFTVEESRPGASQPVLVASHAMWVRLGRPANFVGSTLRVEDRSYTVIGVTPPAFVGLHVSIGPDAWLPLGEAASVVGWDLQRNTTTQFNLHARLQPDISLTAATSQLAAANRRLNEVPAIDQTGPRRLILAPPSRTSLDNAQPEDETFLTLFAALALCLSLTVLIVACLNLANMLLARGVARQKEIATRLALGASRWRVVRGLLAEGVLLALLGGGLSLFLSGWSSALFLRWSRDAFAAGTFALSEPAFLDPSVAIATLGFSLFAVLGFSLWPALRVTRPDLVSDLKQLPGGQVAAGHWNRLFSFGQIPLITQIALSLALLFSAALFVRGSWNAATVGLGFQPAQQLVANVDYKLTHLDRNETLLRQQALLVSTAALPGVTGAALASNVPYNFELPFRNVRKADSAAGPKTDNSSRLYAGYTAVTRGYFETLGITLLRGRDFSPEESAGNSSSPVAIIDETLAHTLFGETDALGQRIVADVGSAGNTPLEVVGIVRSPRDDVFGERLPKRIYRPLGQSPETSICLHLRTPEPLALTETLRSSLRTLEPDATVLYVRPLANFVEQNINMLLVRLAAMLFGAFGGIALLLSVVGVYGVKAHAVARRTREIGIRVALGASPGDVMALILKQGAIQAAVGVAFGIALALGSGRLLASMLYRVSPADPVALAGSALVLATAVLFACWLPARRATKVDPLVAIRTE